MARRFLDPTVLWETIFGSYREQEERDKHREESIRCLTRHGLSNDWANIIHRFLYDREKHHDSTTHHRTPTGDRTGPAWTEQEAAAAVHRYHGVSEEFKSFREQAEKLGKYCYVLYDVEDLLYLASLGHQLWGPLLGIMARHKQASAHDACNSMAHKHISQTTELGSVLIARGILPEDNVFNIESMAFAYNTTHDQVYSIYNALGHGYRSLTNVEMVLSLMSNNKLSEGHALDLLRSMIRDWQLSPDELQRAFRIISRPYRPNNERGKAHYLNEHQAIQVIVAIIGENHDDSLVINSILGGSGPDDHWVPVETHAHP